MKGNGNIVFSVCAEEFSLQGTKRFNYSLLSSLIDFFFKEYIELFLLEYLEKFQFSRFLMISFDASFLVSKKQTIGGNFSVCETNMF